jgi:DNA-binding MarR family transcriptional regulator
MRRREPVPSFGDVLDFMRMMWAVSHGLQATSKRMDRTLGVTGPQRLVIRVVGRLPGMSAGALADVLHLHPSTLTGVLQRLQQRGLLRRSAEPGDRRRARLYLTAKGERFDVMTKGTVEAAVAQALAVMPRRKVQCAEEALTAVAAALEVPLKRAAQRDSRQRDKARARAFAADRAAV